jgi:hypothetical protein
MDEREKNSLIWNLASKNGILLGMFSTLCLALKQVSALIGSETLASGAGIILWTLEFVGCIWLLRRFMKRYVADYPDATNAETYALGKRTCLFSSLILAAALVFMVLYVPDNLFSRSFQDLSETYSAMLDPSVLEGMNLADRPGIVFFSQFLYCWVYGILVSSFLSRSIPQDPRIQEMLDELNRRGFPDETDGTDETDDQESTDNQ